MKSLPAPREFLDQLEKSSVFIDWRAQHQEAYVSHFFCPISHDLKAKTNWEVGHFSKESEKMTVFTSPQENQFEIKPEDQVFKKDQEEVEKLDLHKVNKNLDEAVHIFTEQFPKLFSNETLGDGFIVLQTLAGSTLWNFTFITKTVKFANIKINAASGEVESHQAVELVAK